VDRWTVPAAVITASASIVVAMLVFILNQYGQIRQERRQARLARVNSQLRELYGPLNALVSVNEQIWERLRETSLPSKEERHPSGETPEWIKWRDNALMPANRRMRDLLVEHSDLLFESSFPQVLLDFCAHVASLEVALATESTLSRGQPLLVGHPGSRYVEYVRDTFAKLKSEQHKLLRSTLQG
jgi:hypothetical protein